MKNTFKLFGIIALVAVIGALTSCASLLPPPKWDSSVPKADLVVLYYPDGFSIDKINGQGKQLVGAVGREYPGNGKLTKPKKSLQIPPGQTTLTMSWKTLIDAIPTEVSFNFVAGGHYQLLPSSKQGIGVGDMSRLMTAGTRNDSDPWDWKVEKIK